MPLTALNKLLQTHDLLVLQFVAKFGVVNERHVKHLFAYNKIDVALLDNILSSLKRRGLINTQKILVNGEKYITLTELSANFLGEKVLSSLPLNKIDHDMLLIDIYFMFCIDNDPNDILTEYSLKKIHGVKLGDKKKIPDLLINGEIAIELELTQKSHNTLVEIISHYLLDNALKQVIYYVKSKSLAKKLLTLSGNHPKLEVYIIEVSQDYSTNIVRYHSCCNYQSYIADFDLDEYLKV